MPCALLSKLALLLLTGIPLAAGQTKPPELAARASQRGPLLFLPELANTEIRVRKFASDANDFQARFIISRFIFGHRMRYVIRVKSDCSFLSGISHLTISRPA